MYSFILNTQDRINLLQSSIQSLLDKAWKSLYKGKKKARITVVPKERLCSNSYCDDMVASIDVKDPTIRSNPPVTDEEEAMRTRHWDVAKRELVKILLSTEQDTVSPKAEEHAASPTCFKDYQRAHSREPYVHEKAPPAKRKVCNSSTAGPMVTSNSSNPPGLMQCNIQDSEEYEEDEICCHGDSSEDYDMEESGLSEDDTGVTSPKSN